MQAPPPIPSLPPVADSTTKESCKKFSRIALAGLSAGSICLLVLVIVIDFLSIQKGSQNISTDVKAVYQFGYVAMNVIVPTIAAVIACAFGKRRPASHQFILVFFIATAVLAGTKVQRLPQLLKPSISQSSPGN